MFGYFAGGSETGPDGSGKQRKAIVGTVAALATEAAALKAAHALRIDANQQTPQAEGGPKTIAELIAHYRLKELAGEKQGRKAFSTRAAYECYLKGWIIPRWGDTRLDQVKPVAVEEWLDGIKRAKGTKAKIRNLMSAIFHHAMRYEWIDRNPIKLVRQSAKREKVPDVLELARTPTSPQQAGGPGAHVGSARRGNWPSGQRTAGASLERR